MKKHYLIWLMILLVLIPACQPTPQPATQTDMTSASPTLTLTAVSSPTPTALPEPARAVIFAPPGLPPDVLELQTLFNELAAQSGLVVDTLLQWDAGKIQPSVQVVVLLSPPDKLEQSLAAAPQTQWILVSPVDVPTDSPNLSVLRWHPEWEAFLAGYIAVLVVPDWRVGALIPSDTQLGMRLEEAFLNGSHYFCGQCRSALSPIVEFPVVSSLPSSSDAAAWQASIESLRQYVLYGYYIAPQAASPELLEGMVINKPIFVGGQTPATEAVQARWAATVRSDLQSGMHSLWAQATAGQGGDTLDAPVLVEDVNASFLGGGRLQRVQALSQELLSGAVYPYTIPPE